MTFNAAMGKLRIGLRFGLDASLLTDPMRQHAKYRRHFGKRLAGSRGRHGVGEAVDALHNAVIEYQQAVFKRFQFQTSRVFDEVREDKIVPLERSLKRIQGEPRFQALSHVGKTETAIKYRRGCFRGFASIPKNQNAAIAKPIHE
jgi:hypothetical protein